MCKNVLRLITGSTSSRSSRRREYNIVILGAGKHHYCYANLASSASFGLADWCSVVQVVLVKAVLQVHSSLSTSSGTGVACLGD